MEQEEAKQKIQRQLDALRHLRVADASDGEFKHWKRNTELAIEYVFGRDTRHLNDLASISWTPMIYNAGNPDPAWQSAFRSARGRAEGVLRSMIEEVEEYWGQFGTAAGAGGADAIAVIERICNRFHLVARQLRSRHANRATLEVEDEYDVQDLLHALLKIHFDDVRPEQWTPGYAGKSARVDFHLKSQEIIVEVKKTRKGLDEKEIGDQLIIDISRYQRCPDCKKLVCFVYDPEMRIGNPPSLETDLSQRHDKIDVVVLVAPKGT
jgi:REase_DpnII-MboI